MILPTKRSGNIIVRGRTLSPAEYHIIAPYLGLSLKQRIARATNNQSKESFQQKLQARKTDPLAYFILNTPCNRTCKFCFFEPAEKPTADIDWKTTDQQILLAKQNGFQTKVYPKEMNASDDIFRNTLALMQTAQETFMITNGERPLQKWQLEALANSSLGHIVVSFLPRSQFISQYGKDSYANVATTISQLTAFSRQYSTRPFTVGLFTQIEPEQLDLLKEVAAAAIGFGVDAINFRLTRSLGQAKKDSTPLSFDQLDAFLLAFIDLRKTYPKETLRLLLSSAMFGPNYYSPGMFRYQLGMIQDPYFTSKYPCPMLDDNRSFSVLVPGDRRIFCPTLVAEELTTTVINDHINFPSPICQPCDALTICRGGCIASRLQGNHLTDIKNSNLDICITAGLRRWETNLVQ